jgi:predicted short-subunit dehydrogenase-like oxidoreductase (DUF2520 family)
MRSVRFIGTGRAGSALARALAARGWQVTPPLRHSDDLGDAAVGVDLLVLAVPDGAIAEVASAVRPQADTVVAHLAGSLGVDVLGAHPRRAAIHPLVPLPETDSGARRLCNGATFAVAGDPLATEVVASLGGRLVEVADEDRAAYHAAACIAANHVVALLGQVERVAATVGLDLGAFLGLTAAAVDDVRALGPRRALTGPASREDWATLDRHLLALDPAEHSAYKSGVGLAIQLAADPVAPPEPAAPATAPLVEDPAPLGAHERVSTAP